MDRSQRANSTTQSHFEQDNYCTFLCQSVSRVLKRKMYCNIAIAISLVWLLNSANTTMDNAIWTSFATSPSYRNSKIFQTASFLTVNISKEASFVSATMSCTQLCARNQSCQASNFYETSTNYICELLAENFCSNKNQKSLLVLQGSIIWDKVTDGRKEACFETNLKQITNSSNSCEVFRPGCLGTWPNCYNCTKTCLDWQNRIPNGGGPSYTLWPDGDSQDSVPIFGQCFATSTYLIRRKLSLTTGTVTIDYRMSLYDIHRVCRLGAYPLMRFLFKSNAGADYTSIYENFWIDANGTLSNMTFHSSAVLGTTFTAPGDILKLGGKALSPKPFIDVFDDIYGCGSFWLLAPNNSTYCPGGELRMLGAFKAGSIPSTGIRFPGAPPSEIFTTASLLFITS